MRRRNGVCQATKANRQNSKKSTGPKDTTATSQNARKHGLRAKKLHLPHLSEQAEEIVRGIFDDLDKNYDLSSSIAQIYTENF